LLSVAIAAWMHAAAAAAVGVGALVVIYLRGYLVPGTPALTKRYLPERVLAWFGTDGAAGGTISGTEVDPGVVLIAANVLVDRPGAPDASVEPAFATAWESRTRRLRDDAAASGHVLETQFDVSFEEFELVPFDSGCGVYLDEEYLGTWESPAAFYTDLAAMELLADHVTAWPQFGIAARSEIVGALRLFVRTCPDCGGDIALGEVTVQSCCADREVIATTCEACGTRILELNMSVDEIETNLQYDD
jgi:hypothetical protein